VRVWALFCAVSRSPDPGGWPDSCTCEPQGVRLPVYNFATMQLRPDTFAGLICACMWLWPVDGSGRNRRFLEEPSNVDYDTLPGLPTRKQVHSSRFASKMETSWGEVEAYTAKVHSSTAQNMESAARNVLVAKTQELQLETMAREAKIRAAHTTELRKKAEAAARRAEAMVADLHNVAQKAVYRAVSDAVSSAVTRMNAEASEVVKAQRQAEADAEKLAAKNAQVEALPFQQAKLRAGQAMVSYVVNARDLANAVGHLKPKAMEIAGQAAHLQHRGDVVGAQRLQMQAVDLMDKAEQMAAQASSFSAQANKINGELGAYDLGASAAAAYAAYQANPGGGADTSLPPLPKPLSLAVESAKAPAPAPAKAGAPATPSGLT